MTIIKTKTITMKAKIIAKLKSRLKYLQSMANTTEGHICSNYKIRVSEVKECIKMLSENCIIQQINL